MRAAILGEPGGWHVASLADALDRRGHAVQIVRWAEVTAAVGGDRETCGPAALAEADVVAVRGMPGIGTCVDRLEGVVFRMDAVARLEAGGTPIVNRPRALEIAIDKYLSLALLAAAGIDVPRTIVVQDAGAAERAWQELGCDCVAKPLFGSRGRGLVRITDPAAVAAVMAAANGVAYLQEFVPHAGWDVRILVVGERTFSMRRIARPGDWRTNLSLGGRAEPFVAPPAWQDVARRAAAAVGASVAGVDVLPRDDGRPVVLEVNAVPGWRGLQSAIGVDCAAEIAVELERAAGFRQPSQAS